MQTWLSAVIGDDITYDIDGDLPSNNLLRRVYNISDVYCQILPMMIVRCK